MKKIIFYIIVLAALLICSCSGNASISMIQIQEKNFSISQTEITQAQFEEIMNENPSIGQGGNLPVNNVSWFDAITFCNKLSIKQGLDPVYSINGKTDPEYWAYIPCQGKRILATIDTNLEANGFRLPTNDEWQFAAQGGIYCDYSGSNNVEEVAWYNKNSKGKPHPVARKKANGYNIYDMSGNVWEWTENQQMGNQRMFRGGSWNSMAMYQRIDAKFFMLPYYRGKDMGFRIAKNIGAGM